MRSKFAAKISKFYPMPSLTLGAEESIVKVRTQNQEIKYNRR